MDDRRAFRPARRPVSGPARPIAGTLLAVVLALAMAWLAPVAAESSGSPPSATPMAADAPMDHRTPFYREGTFHALVGGVVIAAGLFVYRVLRSRPRRRAGPAAFVSEAVLAVDLTNSTRLATHYGEAIALRARNALEEQIQRLTEPTRTFIETTGDGCLVTFPAVMPAFEAALALVHERHERPADLGAAVAPVELRVGVTYGEILLDARGARHGAAINKAYRLLSVKPKDLAEVRVDVERSGLTEGTRILVDEDAAQEIAPTGSLAFVGYARLRGFTGLHALYEARWRASAEARSPAGPALAAPCELPDGREARRE